MGMRAEERKTAAEAAFLLESRVFSDAFAALDAAYVREWRSATDREQREAAWQKQRVLQEVRRRLMRLVEEAAFKEDGDDFKRRLKTLGE